MKTQFKSESRKQKQEIVRAFTLIELLIVIAIIAILASLLLPTLNKTKGKAQSAKCVSNLKQLQLGWQNYVDANNDYLPPNNSDRDGDGFTQTAVSNAWGNSWVWGNARTDTSTSNIEHGVLFQYLDSAGIYRCPADTATVTDRPDLLRFRSYTAQSWLNSHIVSGDLQEYANDDPLNKRKHSQLAHSSRTFVFLDEHPQSIDDGIFGIPFDGGWWGASMPADRHGQGCNLSFADGHVDHYHWKWPKKGMTGGSVQRTANPQDLKDLQRLQEGVPGP